MHARLLHARRMHAKSMQCDAAGKLFSPHQRQEIRWQGKQEDDLRLLDLHACNAMPDPDPGSAPSCRTGDTAAYLDIRGDGSLDDSGGGRCAVREES
ncbi:hypothetical protein JHW43_001858 [Diplocarpon mali]|nr:hypothetical protein JHW43_001858 [Diplocarpon mali]